MLGVHVGRYSNQNSCYVWTHLVVFESVETESFLEQLLLVVLSLEAYKALVHVTLYF